jgi:hypothetical protein
MAQSLTVTSPSNRQPLYVTSPSNRHVAPNTSSPGLSQQRPDAHSSSMLVVLPDGTKRAHHGPPPQSFTALLALLKQQHPDVFKRDDMQLVYYPPDPTIYTPMDPLWTHRYWERSLEEFLELQKVWPH